MATNYRQVFAIQKKQREQLLKLNPNLTNNSGIYLFLRTDPDGITYFYCGQSVHCLDRLISHMNGYSHIDLSIKKRKLYSEDNPYGWKIKMAEYPIEKLDEMERYWILEMQKRGYQARYNKTAGGQGEGKEKINEYKPAKGYRDGIKQGKKSLARDLSGIIDKHLEVKIQPGKENNKVSQKQRDKFFELIDERSYE